MPSINSLRDKHHLPRVDRLLEWWHSPDCNLCLFPDWYASKQSDWPENSYTSNFPLWDEGAGEPLQPEIEEFLTDGEPPIVFTPGSGNQLASRFFATANEVCWLLGKRGMLMTRFSNQIPNSLHSNVRHFNYAPFATLLPRAAAIVHHGGIGTVSQALRAGIPQLIMPLSHDQPDNSHRLTRLGVGAEVRPAVFRPRRVANELGALLASSSVRANCAEVASRFTADDPFERPCAIIEEVFAKR